MDHMAYRFDHGAFNQEPAAVLQEALERGDVGRLRALIRGHLAELTDQGR